MKQLLFNKIRYIQLLFAVVCSAVCFGQDTIAFVGPSQLMPNSYGALMLPSNYANVSTIAWQSSDPALGTVNISAFTPASWSYTPSTASSPARLIFTGTSGLYTLSGSVIFDSYNQAVIDITDNVHRVRYLLKLAVVRLLADGNHDNVIQDAPADNNTKDTLPGVIVLNNCDDDAGVGRPDNTGPARLTVINANDASELAEVIIRKIPFIPPGWTVSLNLNTPTNVDAGLGARDIVRIFEAKAAGANAIMGSGLPGANADFTLPAAAAANNVDIPTLLTRNISLGVEGLEFAGEVKLRLQLKTAAGVVVSSDRVQLKVSPLMLLPHTQVAFRTWCSQVNLTQPAGDPRRAASNRFCNIDFPGAVPSIVPALPFFMTKSVITNPLNGDTDVWAQDQFQVCFQQAPYKSMYVVLDSIRDRPLKAYSISLIAPNFGYFEEPSSGVGVESMDSFGNLEVSPPCTVGASSYPLGRIYYGANNAAGGRSMDPAFIAFLNRQQVQSPVPLYSAWLIVGHVDEFITFIPDARGVQGFRALLADPKLALDILLGRAGQPGVDPMLAIPRYVDFNAGGVVVNSVKNLLKRDLSAPLLPAEISINQYNSGTADEILFGPSPARNGGIRADIRTAFGIGNADIISVPTLFDHRARGADAITPGLVNADVHQGATSTYYIAPDPFLHDTGAVEEDTNGNFMLDAGEDTNGDGLLQTLRDPFEVYMASVLPGSITPEYIDDWDIYHLGIGEVHCGTNEQRALPALKWWN